jgi:hypothetical protein
MALRFLRPTASMYHFPSGSILSQRIVIDVRVRIQVLELDRYTEWFDLTARHSRDRPAPPSP